MNLSVCDNTTIDIYIPLVLSEELQNLYNQIKDMGYDLFDINSGFYQDYCTPFTSPYRTDVLLSDRIYYYYNNNETLCQSNCEFSSYSMETQYLKCECDVNNSEINTITYEKFTKKTIYESFYNTLKFSNYKVLFCYKLAFHINSITINKGSIIAIIYFVIYFIFLMMYSYKGIRQFKIEIAREIFKKRFPLNVDDIEKKIIAYEPDNNNQKSYKFTRHKSSSNALNKIKGIYNYPPKKSSLQKSINKKGQKRNRNHQSVDVRFSDKRLMDTYLSTKVKFPEIDSKNKISDKENKNSNTEIIEDNTIKVLDNYELNNLEYEMALKYDKRSLLNIYWSLLKREHIIFFSIFVRNDHNLVYVKFARLIFLICSDMAMNVFFFSDETMHKMHIDYGKYNFLQQIPQIVISTVVSQIIDIFICFLSLTDKHYYEIKELDRDSRYEIFGIIRCVRNKIIFFFIFTFLMFAFYWYSIACFCAVYVNTQTAFIKDSISSFALGLLYPFFLYIFPSIFRIISLRCSKGNLSCIYKLSDIIPFF